MSFLSIIMYTCTCIKANCYGMPRFWIIALPVMGAIIPIFIYSDIKKMVKYLQKKMAGQRIAQVSVLVFFSFCCCASVLVFCFVIS